MTTRRPNDLADCVFVGRCDGGGIVVRQNRVGCFFRADNQFIVIYSGSGTNTGAPLFLTKNAMNFAGLVLLAFLPTT